MTISKTKESTTFQFYRIVVVEDDDGLGKLIQKTLKRKGIKSEICTTGKEALSKVRGELNEILVLDYNLPDMTGEKVIEILKEKHGKTPVFMIMTGIGNEKIAVKMMKMGAKHYIVKEADLTEILPEKIKLIAEEVNQQRELEETKSELESSKQDFQLLFNTMSEGIVYQNQKGEIISANPAAEKILGLSFDHSTGITSTDPRWKAVDEDFNELSNEQLPAMVALKTGQRIENFIHGVFNSQKNNYVWVLVNSVPQFKKGESTPFQVYSTYNEITKLKAAEKKLQDSEEKYRSIFENSAMGIFRSTPEGRYQIVNEAFARILGFDSPKKMIDEVTDISQLYKYSEDREKIKKELAGKGFIEDYEVVAHHPNKKTVWISINARKLQQQDGTIYYEGTVQDITEKKIAEKKEKESREEIARILENSMDGILLTAPDGSVLSANPAACKMFGRTEKEICEIGKNGLVDLNDSRLAKFLKIRDEQGKAKTEINLLRKDGTTFPAEVSSALFKDKDGNLRSSMIIRDITEWKNAEVERRKSDERFRIAQEMSPDGFTILQPVRDNQDRVIDFIWVYENEAIANLNGTDPQKIVGKRLLEMFPGHKDSEFLKAYKNVAESGNPTTFEEGYSGETMSKSTWFRIVVVPMEENIAILSQDITERRITEENFKNTFNLSPSIIAKANLKKGYYIEANQAVTRILGYSIEEFTSKPINDFIHEDDIQSTSETISKQLGGNDVLIFENRFLCKDGSYKWISWNANKANDEGIVLGVGSDVTERKKAEKKLKESEASLQDAQRIAKIGNWTLDLKTGAVEMSDQMLHLIGFNHREEGLNVIDHKQYYTPESWLVYNNALEKTISTGKSYKIELEFSSRNTKYRYALARGEAIFDDKNNVIGLKGTLQDITLIKKAEQELRNKNEELLIAKENAEKSERHFRTMFSEAPLGIALINSLNGKIYEVNQKFAEIAGRTKQEMSTIDWMSITHPDDVQEDLDNMALLNTRKIKGFNMQKRYIKPDGSYVWINLTVTSIFVGNNKEPQHLAMIEDITKQRLYEDELIKSKEKAEESDRLKSAFLANMSHEIRTPMNGILGFTDLLKDTDLSGEHKTQFINEIHKSGKRLLNTVTDIVDISKIEAGLVKVSKTELDVNKELESMYSFFYPEADQKGLELSLEQLLPENSKIILTDKTKFQSILTNLIKNAIKYTPKGSIKFGCRLMHDQLEFYVEDTGIGIPANRKHAIFDRFVQADIADTRVFEGSGLGLAISKAYVEMLGGQIGVESQVDKGSTFWVLLPLQAYEKKKPVTKNFAGVELSEFNNKIKILIAEDDEPSYIYLRYALNKIGNEFIHARNGLQAVEFCKTNTDIDLILMDIKMPDMDGYKAVREIRKFNKKVPIITQTAHALAGDREMAFDAGCNDYITKPIDKKLLLQKINKLIDT